MASSDKKDHSNKKGFIPPKPDMRVEERSTKKPTRCEFPGPTGVKVPLRVAMDKDAYAQITAHAAASLDAEICGVLAGTQCEDDDGPFLKVTAAVRGETARKGSTHVTFTHETWDVIHKTMEKEHPKLDIVGWYHSHPGFGVEFSEMDIFIQQNFFKAETQVAFVVDPLGGQTAMCVDTPDGIKYIDRFWVEGREQKCQTPRRGKGASTSEDADDEEESTGKLSADPSMRELARALEDVQTRLAQAIQAVDDQRNWIYRTILTFGMTICTAVIIWIGWSIYRAYASQYSPPEGLNVTWVPQPIMIDNKPVILGFGVVKWNVPPELNAVMIQVEKERQEKAAAATQQAASQPSSQPATAPAR